MSYYTDIEFTFSDERPDFEAVLDRRDRTWSPRRTGIPTSSSSWTNCVMLSKRRRATSRDCGPMTSKG